MALPSDSSGVSPVDPAAAPVDPAAAFDACRQLQAAPDDGAAWLRQATRAREGALRLLQHGFQKDLEAGDAGSTGDLALPAADQESDRLTADYLAQSEKLFELASRLGRR